MTGFIICYPSSSVLENLVKVIENVFLPFRFNAEVICMSLNFARHYCVNHNADQVVLTKIAKCVLDISEHNENYRLYFPHIFKMMTSLT